jgi:hypothetical protein
MKTNLIPFETNPGPWNESMHCTPNTVTPLIWTALIRGGEFALRMRSISNQDLGEPRRTLRLFPQRIGFRSVPNRCVQRRRHFRAA